MTRKKKIAFVCFGEVNTPFEKLVLKHDEALRTLSRSDTDIIDAGIVIDDPEYKTADSAIEKLKHTDMDCLVICVAGWIPTHAVIRVMPTAFGLLSKSLLNVSKVKTGIVTCARLTYKKGRYFMHIYTGKAKTPPLWEEFGWEAPAPYLPSLEIEPTSCTVEEFAQKVSSQHVIIAYGEHMEALCDLCALLEIQVI